MKAGWSSSRAPRSRTESPQGQATARGGVRGLSPRRCRANHSLRCGHGSRSQCARDPSRLGLVNHDLPSAEVKRWMTMSHRPTTAAHHLSADLVFRLLPQIRKRAMGAIRTRSAGGTAYGHPPAVAPFRVLANLDDGPDGPPEAVRPLRVDDALCRALDAAPQSAMAA